MLKQLQIAQILPIKYSQYIIHWESFQKLVYQWYHASQKLTAICTNQSSLCWRQFCSTRSSLHISWQCPVIKHFWTQVFQLIAMVTNMDISNDPKLALLVLGMDPWPYKFHALLTHFFIAARLYFARNWKISKAQLRM